jgi:DNA-binding transcriptional MerR regulator
MSVFIGVSLMHGFSLDDIKDYMDIGAHDVDNQARVFEERMAKMRDRIALEVETPKEEDLALLAYKKAKLVRTAIKLNYSSRTAGLIPGPL